MTDLTPAQKEAYARANSSVVTLWAMELRHPVFAEPIRLVQGREDITLTLEANAPANAGQAAAFTAFAFKFKEPDEGTQPDNTVQLQADGVAGIVQKPLAAANATVYPIECTMRSFTYHVKTKAVSQMLSLQHWQVRHVRVTKTSVALTCGYTNAANREFPSEYYTAESNPGLI